MCGREEEVEEQEGKRDSHGRKCGKGKRYIAVNREGVEKRAHSDTEQGRDKFWRGSENGVGGMRSERMQSSANKMYLN